MGGVSTTGTVPLPAADLTAARSAAVTTTTCNQILQLLNDCGTTTTTSGGSGGTTTTTSCNALLQLLNDCGTTTTTSSSTTTTTTSPTTTTTTTGGSGSDACADGGTPAELGVGTSWTCTFDDKFANDTGLNTSKWQIQDTSDSAYTTGTSPYEPCYGSDPSTVTVSGGALNLGVKQEATSSACPGLNNGLSGDSTQYAAGEVTTDGTFSQEYGLFEVSAKIPSYSGPRTAVDAVVVAGQRHPVRGLRRLG
jgi:hypothetical protein